MPKFIYHTRTCDIILRWYDYGHQCFWCHNTGKGTFGNLHWLFKYFVQILDQSSVYIYIYIYIYIHTHIYIYIIGLVQERHNSIANALELRLSCINPSILGLNSFTIVPANVQAHNELVILQIFFLSFNPLRAKFFRENINIYLHFVSYLHIDMTRVAEILPRIGQGLAHST